MASTDTENTFSVHNPFSIQTHTHLTKCHEILTQVVARQNNAMNYLVLQGSYENAEWAAWSQS